MQTNTPRPYNPAPVLIIGVLVLVIAAGVLVYGISQFAALAAQTIGRVLG